MHVSCVVGQKKQKEWEAGREVGREDWREDNGGGMRRRMGDQVTFSFRSGMEMSKLRWTLCGERRPQCTARLLLNRTNFHLTHRLVLTLLLSMKYLFFNKMHVIK